MPQASLQDRLKSRGTSLFQPYLDSVANGNKPYLDTVANGNKSYLDSVANGNKSYVDSVGNRIQKFSENKDQGFSK